MKDELAGFPYLRLNELALWQRVALRMGWRAEASIGARFQPTSLSPASRR